MTLERPAAGSRSLALALAAVAALTLVARLATLSGLVEHVDGQNFVLALREYSVHRLQPHFPGYPVYVWLGRLALVAVGDPVYALQALSGVCAAACVWPLGLLAWRLRLESGSGLREARVAAFVAALIWSASPLAWLVGTEVLSDVPGLLVALLFLWCATEALTRKAPRPWLIVAGLLAGLLPGVRMALAPFIVVLVLLVWRFLRQPGRESGRLLGVAAMALVLPVLTWLGWQAAQDGWDLVRAGRTHLAGHYSEWGGGVALDPHPLSRPWRFAAVTLGDGFALRDASGEPRWVALAGVAPLLMLGVARTLRHRGSGLAVLTLAGAAYAVWILAGHDPGEPRYALPLVALACVLAGAGVPSRPTLAGAVVSAALLGIVSSSVPLARAHARSPRLGYDAVLWFVSRTGPPAELLITDGSRLLGVYFMWARDPRLGGRRLPTAALPELVPVAPAALRARAHAASTTGRAVYAFEIPPDAAGDWRPAARFCRDRRIDPQGPTELVLLEFAPAARGLSMPGCWAPARAAHE